MDIPRCSRFPKTRSDVHGFVIIVEPTWNVTLLIWGKSPISIDSPWRRISWHFVRGSFCRTPMSLEI